MIKEGHFDDRRFNESFATQDLAWREEREFVGMDEEHYDRMRMKLESEVKFEMQKKIRMHRQQIHSFLALSLPLSPHVTVFDCAGSGWSLH